MFKLQKSTTLPLFGQSVLAYRHEVTGAEHWHVVSDHGGTECRIFLNTFDTSNKGGLHVLEHMTLCGSKKYPGVDLFAAHRGVNFEHGMNAMTGTTSTVYQFGASVQQGFLNTLDIVMDAVLHPELDEAMFYREGIRFERDENGAYSPSGIVFNEMSEVYQDSETVAYFEMLDAMNVPEIYRVHTGGRPDEIVKLTYDEVVALHTKFYHPSNMTIITVGDADITKIHAYLDNKFAEYAPSTRYDQFPAYTVGQGEATFVLNGPALADVNVSLYIPLQNVSVPRPYLSQLCHILTQSAIGIPVWLLGIDEDISFEDLQLAQMSGCLNLVYAITTAKKEENAILFGTLKRYAQHLASISEEAWAHAWKNHLREEEYRRIMIKTGSRFNDQLASYLVEVLESNDSLEAYADDGWKQYFAKQENAVNTFNQIVANVDESFVVSDMYQSLEGKPQWLDIVSRVEDYVASHSLVDDVKWDKQVAKLWAYQAPKASVPSVAISDVEIKKRASVPEMVANHANYHVSVYQTPDLAQFSQITVQYPVYDLRDESVFRVSLLAMLVPRMALKGYSYEETLAMIENASINFMTDVRHIPNSKEATMYFEFNCIVENKDMANMMAILTAFTTELDYSSDEYARPELHDQLVYRQRALDEDLSSTLRYVLNAQLDESSLIGYKTYSELLPFLMSQLDNYQGDIFADTAKELFANKPRIYAYSNDPLLVLQTVDAAFKTAPRRSPKHSPVKTVKLPESFYADISVGSAMGVAPIHTVSVRDEAAVELVTGYLSGLAFHLFREKGGAYSGHAGFDSIKRLFTIKSDQDPNMDSTLQYIDSKAWLNPEFNAQRWESTKRSLLTAGIRPASSLKIAAAQMTAKEWHRYPPTSVFDKKEDLLSLSFEEAVSRFNACIDMTKFVSGRTGRL